MNTYLYFPTEKTCGKRNYATPRKFWQIINTYEEELPKSGEPKPHQQNIYGSIVKRCQ